MYSRTQARDPQVSLSVGSGVDTDPGSVGGGGVVALIVSNVLTGGEVVALVSIESLVFKDDADASVVISQVKNPQRVASVFSPGLALIPVIPLSDKQDDGPLHLRMSTLPTSDQ